MSNFFQDAVTVAGTVFVGVTVGWTSAIIWGLSTKYQQVEAEKAQERLRNEAEKAAEEADKLKGFQIVQEGSIWNVPVIYGRAKIGGSRVFHRVADDFTFVPAVADANVFLTSGDTRATDHAFGYGSTTTLVALAVGKNTWGSIINATAYVQYFAGFGLTRNVVGPWEALSATYIGGTLTRDASGNVSLFVHPGRADVYGLAVEQTVDLFYKPYPTDIPPWLNAVTGVNTFDINATTTLKYKITSYNASTGALNLTPAVFNPLYFDDYNESSLSTSYDGAKREILFFNQVLSWKGIREVYYVEINDKAYNDEEYGLSGRIHIHKDGGMDTLMSTNFPFIDDDDTVAYNSNFPETAYAVGAFKLNRDDPEYNGVPTLNFSVEGAAVHTIDKNLEVYSLSALKSYTNNTALVLLDYMMDTEYGANLPLSRIDLASFYRAAVLCETSVIVNGSAILPAEGVFWKERVKTSDKTLRRYEFNGIIDTENSVRTNIEKILENLFQARLFWSDGKYKLSLKYPAVYAAGTYQANDTVQYFDGVTVDLYRAVSTTSQLPTDATWTRDTDDPELVSAYLTDDDILGTEANTIVWPGLTERYNFCTVEFVNDAKNFEKDTVHWPDKYGAPSNLVYQTYLAEDNGLILETTKSPAGITDAHHAMAVAEETVRRSRHESMLAITLSAPNFRHLEPGDVVHVSSIALGIQSSLFILNELKTTDDDHLEVAASLFDATTFAWNAPDNEIITPVPSYSTAIPQVTDLVFTAPVVGDIYVSSGRLTWTAAKASGRVRYHVYLATETDEAGIVIATVSEPTYVLPQLGVGPKVFMIAVEVAGKQSQRNNLKTHSRWAELSVDPAAALTTLTRTDFVVYKAWGATVAAPTGGGYDFLTKVLTPPAGWYATRVEAIAAAVDPASPGNIYVSAGQAQVDWPITLDTTLGWSAPDLDQTTPMQSTKTIYLTVAAASGIPATPVGGSVAFPSEVLSAIPAGWSEAIPAGLGVTYVSYRSFSRIGVGPNEDTNLWSTPVLLLSAGSQSGRIKLFHWGTVQPIIGAGASSVYDWTLDTQTSLANLAGWATTVPARPSTEGLFLFQTSKVLFETAGVGLTNVDWTANGTVAAYPTVDEGRTVTISIFKWDVGVPAAFAAVASTYTWATGVSTGVPAGWSSTGVPAPVAGATLYEAQVTIIENLTALTSPYFWSDATAQVNGYAGTDGTGVTTYTWIKYADNATGTVGLTDDPTGKLYLGLAHNKSTAVEGVIPGDYAWSLIGGPAGDNGTNGTSSYTHIRYSTEAFDAPPTTMTVSPGAATAALGMLVSASATPSSTVGDYTWSGFRGPQGVPGDAGANGITTYTWVKYAPNADGTGLVNDPTGMSYIGLAPNQIVALEGTDPLAYTWSLIVGPQGLKGDQGIVGATGDDGVTFYTWIKYSDLANPTLPSHMYDIPISTTISIGIAANQAVQAEGSDPTVSYVWSSFKGEQGLPGVNGTAGDNGTSSYLHIKYSDNPSGNPLTANAGEDTGDYIGVLTDAIILDSLDYLDYTWSPFKGEAGSTTYYQTATPGAPVVSDLWYNANTSRLQRWSGSAWELVGNVAPTTYAQATAPVTGLVIGDLWIDTDDNQLHRYNGAWVALQDNEIGKALFDAAQAQFTAEGKVDTYFQPTAPAGTLGDLWFDTDDNNTLYRHNGTAYAVAKDLDIAAAQLAASTADSKAVNAQSTADGKIATYYTTTQPTVINTPLLDLGDLWYNTSTSLLARWTGSVWESVSTYNTGALANQDTVTTIDIDPGAVTQTVYAELAAPWVSDVHVRLGWKTYEGNILRYIGRGSWAWIQRPLAAAIVLSDTNTSLRIRVGCQFAQNGPGCIVDKLDYIWRNYLSVSSVIYRKLSNGAFTGVGLERNYGWNDATAGFQGWVPDGQALYLGMKSFEYAIVIDNPVASDLEYGIALEVVNSEFDRIADIANAIELTNAFIEITEFKR